MLSACHSRWFVPRHVARRFAATASEAALPAAGGGDAATVLAVGRGWDPRLALYRQERRRRRPSDREALASATRCLRARADGECVVGVHFSAVCLRRLRLARAAGREVVLDSVLLPESASEDLKELALAASSVVYSVPEQLFTREFQWKAAGKAAAACSFAVAFPVSRPLAGLQPPFVVLDDVRNSRNIGEILRTAAHLGITSVIASRASWDSINGRAARTSMGWIYHADFHVADPLSEALDLLRQAGCTLYAASSRFASPVGPHGPPGDRRWALIVGNEDTGLSEESRAMSDQRITVKSRGGECLNVAQATAICLYELGRDLGYEGTASTSKTETLSR